LSAAQKIRILLLEDSASDALLIDEALSDLSDIQHELTHTDLLSEGLALARKTHFDIVLLDLGLPDAQGMDTFREFHRQVPDVPVLVLTGLDDISVGLLAIQEGAQDYLIKKDIHSSLLGRALRYAMERHHVAVALATSEERFQLAVSGAAAGLWDWDLRTDSIYFAPRFKEIMGYRQDDLPNEVRAHQDAIHPDDVDQVMANLKAHMDHESVYDEEYRVRTQSGDFKWIQSLGQALWTDSGEPYRMVGWIMDISDRKRAEDALRTSREELQRLSANIQHMREEEKTRIARELHDDLGQQLTALKMEVELAERRLKKAEPRSPGGDLRKIYELIDQLAGSVRRIAADLRPLMLDDLGLIPAIDWLTNEFSARHNVRVTTHVAVQEIVFNSESGTAVFRMVQEALTNIARHSGASEATLDIVRDEANCIVRVIDNGRGTAQGARVNRRSFGLLGLRERAAQLDGEIQISTAPDMGFALTITLPLARVQAIDVDCSSLDQRRLGPERIAADPAG
jgi:two-component system, NarL family, sensor histidine kinase UhpB